MAGVSCGAKGAPEDSGYVYLLICASSSTHWTKLLSMLRFCAVASLHKQLNPLDMRFPSRANAGVLIWAGKLYALSQVRRMGETGMPLLLHN